MFYSFQPEEFIILRGCRNRKPDTCLIQTLKELALKATYEQLPKGGISSPLASRLCGCSHNVRDNCSLKRPLPQRAHNSFRWTTTLEILKEVLSAQVLSQGVEAGNKQRLTQDELKQEIKLGPGMAAGCREEQMGLAVALH